MTLDVYRGDALAFAKTWAALHPDERRRRAIHAVVAQDVATLTDLLVSHHARRHGEGSAETRRKYVLGARAWLAFAHGNAVNVLHPVAEHADLWLRHLEHAEKKAPASVKVLLAGARALYAALRWAGAPEADPFRDAKPQRDKQEAWHKRRPYPEDHLDRLLSAADEEMRVLLRLGGVAGLRARELTDLAWTDVDFDAETLRVRRGKGGKVRYVLLSASLLADLRALRAARPDAVHVVGRTPEAARKRLRTLCRRADVPYLGLHALRHAAGTRLVRAGLDLQDVAEHLGAPRHPDGPRVRQVEFDAPARPLEARVTER